MPIDSGVKIIALCVPCVEFSLKSRKVWYTAVEALACKSGKFDFGYIQPGAMFWGVVNFETISAGVLLPVVGKFCKERQACVC